MLKEVESFAVKIVTEFNNVKKKISLDIFQNLNKFRLKTYLSMEADEEITNFHL